MPDSDDTLTATYPGELEIGELTIPCAVLEDGTRVLSERGVTKALGAKRGGSHWERKRDDNGGADLPVYLSASNFKPFIDNELAAALSEPILYTPPHGGPPAHGVRADLLPYICNVILAARDAGELHTSQEHIAKHAEILMRGLAHVGIIALVDEATGYQDYRSRKALEKILDEYIAEEYRAWSKTFPDSFYRQMFRLKGWDYRPSTLEKPGVVGHYTNDIVYERLAPGVLGELRRLNPSDKEGNRPTKHHQWLSEEVGHPKLREHLAAVIALMRTSSNWEEFQHRLRLAFPKPHENLEMPLGDKVVEVD